MITGAAFLCFAVGIPAGRYMHSSGPLRAPTGYVHLCIGVNLLLYFMFVVAHVYLPIVMS